MRIWSEWDERDQVLTLYTEDCALTDANSVREWAGLVTAQLASHGKRALLLICVDGVKIHPSAAPLYGVAAKEILTKHALAWARYGRSGSRAIIAVEALNRGMDPHLFDTRQSAIAFLKAPGSQRSLTEERR
jgi:hypothetical protein